jgi:DNA-binding HxlR family transcriptional regulator
MPKEIKSTITSRASSINRALDQIGDKWCLLIIEELFWGINTFNALQVATGASRGVLTDRLNWLQTVDCLRKNIPKDNVKRPIYQLTKKSLDLYHTGLMAILWERKYFTMPVLDQIEFIHTRCGHSMLPVMSCGACDGSILFSEVFYRQGPGSTKDIRPMKVRRRSSVSMLEGGSAYKNLINITGDRWTANLIALAFHRIKRFDEFHKELPIATNILADRLKFLIDQGIFYRQPYQNSPIRYEYHLTDRGRDLYPYFLSLLQWGNKWCGTSAGNPMELLHGPCGHDLVGNVRCDHCGEKLVASEVVQLKAK